MATQTGISALQISNTIDIDPTSHPESIHAFVAPGFPSPVLLTSIPEKVLTQIRDQGTEPLINPMKVHSRMSYIDTPAFI